MGKGKIEEAESVLLFVMPRAPSSPRDLLIALSTLPEGPRGAVYQLSRQLAGLSQEQSGVDRGINVRAEAVLADATEISRQQSARATALGASIATILDDSYPESLRQVDGAPTVLFVRGTIPDREAIAIVGSRRPDSYGVEVAALFAGELARAGLVVVSGFARGIDAAAHRACLAAGAPTVAFLGCGLDIDYPRGHQALADQIAACGALISEFPFGRPPERWHFPVRNRSIAATSLATIVVQATLGSGSLSTAHQALDLGREVFAVPGRILEELSQGTNALIRDGAGLAQHPDDILEALGRASRLSGQASIAAPPALPEDLDDDARELMETLRHRRASSVDELASLVASTTDRLLATLLELELRGLVVRTPGPNYAATLW